MNGEKYNPIQNIMSMAMKIPENIKREDVKKAIEKIDKEGIPSNAHSSTYDLIYNDKKYPPKLVVSYANIFANGSELDRSSFEGGAKTECFRILEMNGFNIEYKESKEKDSFYSELVKFIYQAQTDNLRTNLSSSSWGRLDQ